MPTPEPIEPYLQALIHKYALNIAWDRPHVALGWAAALETDEARERTLVDVAQRWRSQDESAAEAWLEQSPLSAEARERARVPMQPKQMPDRGRGVQNATETP